MTASACLKEAVPLKILDHCKWPPEIMVVPLKCMAANASLKQKSAVTAISTNLFLALGLTPNRANTISKHGQML